MTIAQSGLPPEPEPEPTGAAGIAWSEWGPEAFGRALRENKPILLDIFGLWCHWCHVMDETTYDDPTVIELANSLFVPVRVDTDKRPDVNDRYNQGGWPTTALLEPGGHVIWGATYLPPEDMARVLRQVSDAYGQQRADIARRVQRLEVSARHQKPHAGSLNPAAVEDVLHSIRRNFDAEFGGFGIEPKFPQPAAIDLALRQSIITGDEGPRQVAHASLTGMLPLLDSVDGGFYRYSMTRDWRHPHFEKMLEGNAGLLSAYADGTMVLGDGGFREAVRGVARYLTTTLYDARRGAFFSSQDADLFSHEPDRETIEGESYFALGGPERRKLGEPYVDPTIVTAYNAMAISGFVRAYLALDDPSYLDTARRAAEFLLSAMTAPDGSFYHYFADGPHANGLLADQAHAAQALLDLYEVTSDRRYLNASKAAMVYVTRHLAASGGGFHDTPNDPAALGLLRVPDTPLIPNAIAAKALLRLGILLDDDSWARLARNALSAVSGEYPGQGFMAGDYADAVWRATNEPTTLQVVSGDDGTRRAFAAAALRRCVPGLIVVHLDPATDRGRIAAEGFDPGQQAAYVCRDHVCQRALAPDQIAGLLPATLRR